MKDATQDRARALLDAHVAYVLEQTRGPALAAFIDNEIDAALRDAESIRLDEAVSRDLIKATVHTYAIDLEVSGAIPELVGDISRALLTHETHGRTSLHDLVSDRIFEQFLEKLLELRELREWVVHEIVAQPMYAEVATDTLIEAMHGYVASRTSRASRVPGVAAALRAGRKLGGDALPRLEDAIDESIREYLKKHLVEILGRSERFLIAHFDEERVRALLLEVWDAVKKRKVDSALGTVSARDVEDLFVIGYEYWRELRGTEFYRGMIDGGIDGVFDKYGDFTLRELLEELGITREIMRQEAMRFGPYVIERLHEKGMVEPYVRRHLAGFYESDVVSGILAGDA